MYLCISLNLLQPIRKPQVISIAILGCTGSFIRKDIQNLDLKKMFQIGEHFTGGSIPAEDLSSWQRMDYFDQNTFKISQNRPMLNSTRVCTVCMYVMYV